MVSAEQNLEPVNEISETETPLHSMRLRTKISLAIAGVAIIGASAFGIEAGANDHNSSHSADYAEITFTDNAQAVSQDFAANPSWTQDFSHMADGRLSPKNWVYDIGTGGRYDYKWGNNEAEYYTDNLDNVEIENGSLDITARHQQYDGSDYTSARIKTEGKFDFEYGKLDVVAKLPAGVGTWPAIWALSQNNEYYYKSGPNDPLRYLNPGEIDIMEEVGSQQDIVTSSAQSREYNPTDNTERIAQETVPNATTTYNDYGLEWTPNQLVYTVNGKPYHIVNRQPSATYKQWPYNQPYFLIINDALGGTNGGQDRAQYPPDGINNAALPATFQIQSITYSKYIGPEPK